MMILRALISPSELDGLALPLKRISYCTLILAILISTCGVSAHTQLHIPFITQQQASFRVTSYTNFYIQKILCLRGGNLQPDEYVDKGTEDPNPSNLELSSNRTDTDNSNVTLDEGSSPFIPNEDINLVDEPITENASQLYFEDFVPDEFRLQEENEFFDAEEASFPEQFPDTDVDGEDVHARGNNNLLDEDQKNSETFPDNDIQELKPTKDFIPNGELAKEEPTIGLNLASEEAERLPMGQAESFVGQTMESESKQERDMSFEPSLTGVSSSVVTDDDSSAYLDRMDLADAYDDEDNKDARDPMDQYSISDQRLGDSAILSNQQDLYKQVSFAAESVESATVVDDDLDSSAKVQYMITEHMKRVLIGELGYSKVEVLSFICSPVFFSSSIYHLFSRLYFFPLTQG